MILGVLLLALIAFIFCVTAGWDWAKRALASRAHPEKLPPRSDPRQTASLEHEVWGDREHSDPDVDAHCWTCHPEGTAELIASMSPQDYFAMRPKILGGAITNTPFSATYDSAVKKEAAERSHKAERLQEFNSEAWTNAVDKLAAFSTPPPEHHHTDTSHHTPPPDPGVHHHG